MGRYRKGHGEISVAAADQAVTVAAANTDYEVGGANVELGNKRYVMLDPDRGANPDMKIRVGGGSWEIKVIGTAAASGAVVKAHLYMTPKDGTATEVAFSPDTPSGGGEFALSYVAQVGASGYADFELRVSNETDTTNITVRGGTRISAIGLDERGYRVATA